MAFVLVQHLAPDHKSVLSELIRRYTRMQVFEVEDGMVVRPNCAYVIPPGHDIAFLNGTLQLLAPIQPRGQRLPIDFFFRSLAQDQHERAIGIILSGTGRDGTEGVRAIKGEGGMVMTQSTASAEFDGMPRSAVGTGLVDHELPPAEMPAQLIAYAAKGVGRRPKSSPVPAIDVENAWNKIFILLRAETGHDFSLYKPNTIHRRVERRMAVHSISGIDGYVKFLQQTPAEVQSLFRDLLIGVTSFFRDPEAFQVLEDEVIPALFASKPSGSAIRVWTAGCSTGEEAYSIAMLLMERMESLGALRTLQLFATDIDPQAIATARTGLYRNLDVAGISPARLARFFTAEADGSAYRIHKRIRDLMVFSEQDVIKDPPFSRLDLISCRNLLIYMGAVLQKELIPLFHYALNPGGWLFLGTSEGLGDSGGLFDVVHRNAKLFRRTADLPGAPRVSHERSLPPISATRASVGMAAERGATIAAAGGGKTLRDATEQALLEQVIAVGALVNADGDVLYLHGRTGMFLEPSPGEPASSNILKMAREGLQFQQTSGLRKAVNIGDTVACPGLQVRNNGHLTAVNVTIRPVVTGAGASREAPLFLVTFEEAPPATSPADGTAGDDAASGVNGTVSPDAEAGSAALRAELRATKDDLRLSHEELEVATAERRSSNMELQSVNEELQSTNEELETAQEETQSANEELVTINTELQTKVIALTRANNDGNNLLAGTGIGTVFVDMQMRVLRFTPAASDITNLILSDVGRPIAHVVSNFAGYQNLLVDVKTVLDTLVPREVQLQTLDGRRYTMRILPYRTMDNAIEGAVISFVDVSEMMKAQEALARTEALLQRTGEMAKVGGWELDLVTSEVTYSRETARIHEVDFPYVPPTLSQGNEYYGPEAWPMIQAAVQAAIDHGTPYDLESPFITAKGRHLWVRVQGFPELKDGRTIKLRGTMQDITERKATEDALRKSNDLMRLAVVVRDAHDAITVKDLEGRTLAWNPAAVRMYGWSEAEALQINVRERIPPARRGEEDALIRRLRRSESLEPFRTQRLTKSGEMVEVSMVATPLINEQGELYAIATTERAIEGSSP